MSASAFFSDSYINESEFFCVALYPSYEWYSYHILTCFVTWQKNFDFIIFRWLKFYEIHFQEITSISPNALELFSVTLCTDLLPEL